MKVCFYCHIKRPELLNIIDFYKQDIEILKEIDPSMKIATCVRGIDWNSDIIFIWWWTYAFIPVLIAKLKKKKVVITGTFNFKCPGVDRDYFKRPFWQRALIKFATRFADKNILVSKNEMIELSNEWKFKNFVYSPHCVDTIKYSPNGKMRENYFFTICGLDKQSVIRKCLYETIDAVKILKDDNFPIHLVIAGRIIDAYEDIEKYINDKNLDSSIELIGEISEEEKIKHLQKCKCYLQPSRYEGFGLAIAEAMSCGCNVITSRTGEVPNVVGNTGTVLEETNPVTIAEAIKKTLTDGATTNYFAHDRIVNEFPINRRRANINEIVNSLFQAVEK